MKILNKKVRTIIIGMIFTATASGITGCIDIYTEKELKQLAIQLFERKYGKSKKLTVKSKKEDDGYEFYIVDNKRSIIEEVDCTHFGQCEFD